MVKTPKPEGVEATPRFRKQKAPSDMSKAIFERLSALSNAEPTPEYYAEYQKQVDAENNDRGAVLLVGSTVETYLEFALATFFVVDRISYVLGNEKPLGTFSNKIRMGYAIGLYGKDTYNLLNIVRQIRNAFAHATIPISFETKEVLDAVNLLNVTPLYPRHAQHDPEQVPATTRSVGIARFKHACHWLAFVLGQYRTTPVLEINPADVKDPPQQGYGRILVRRAPLP